MRVSFSVDSPPPRRPHPGRWADRHSPHAAPLVEAGRKVVEGSPEAFPLQQGFGITVLFGDTIPDAEAGGYGPINPVIEILVDVGMIADERQERWERPRQDPGLGTRYTVTIEPVEDD